MLRICDASHSYEPNSSAVVTKVRNEKSTSRARVNECASVHIHTHLVCKTKVVIINTKNLSISLSVLVSMYKYFSYFDSHMRPV